MKLFIFTIITIAAMGLTDKHKHLNNEDSPLFYLHREPKLPYENPPIIILLHGVGSNEKDLFSFTDQLPDSFLVVSARAPYEIGTNSYAWYEVDFSSGKPLINKDQAEKSRTTIIQFVEYLAGQHKFNQQKVYLCGFSQGAIMSYSVGLTYPDKIKGIAIMSGRLLDEVKPLIKNTEQLKPLKVFISHGINDNVLGVHYARESANYLNQLGIHPTYKEYAEGHTISQAMMSDMLDWLK